MRTQLCVPFRQYLELSSPVWQEDIDYSLKTYKCRPGKYIEYAPALFADSSFGAGILCWQPGEGGDKWQAASWNVAGCMRALCMLQPSTPSHALADLCLDVAQWCRNVGWDKDDVWFAHCCMLDKQETQQFADKGIGIAHCPSSNQRLASGQPVLLNPPWGAFAVPAAQNRQVAALTALSCSSGCVSAHSMRGDGGSWSCCAGIAPVRQLLDAGVNVGLGVDGTASNDSGSLIEEARQAMFLQRSGGKVEGAACMQFLSFARALGCKRAQDGTSRIDCLMLQ